MNLRGKTALVTGASRGFGRAAAVALAREGAIVYGGSREPDAVAWPEGVAPVALDVSSPEAAEQSWRSANLDTLPISILVNNAGSGVFGAFQSTDFAAWRGQIELMLLAPMRLCQLAMPRISCNAPGAIVNVGSLAAEFPIPYLSGYNAAKAGLAAFSESLLMEADRERIAILELRLGDLNTDFNGHVARFGEGERLASVWQAIEARAARSPGPEAAARRLIRALRRGERGTVRAGGFFQATLASLFGRLASQGLRRRANLRYYDLKG